MDRRDATAILAVGLVAGAIITLAMTYPHPGGTDAFTSVSTTTDTLTLVNVSTIATTSVAGATDALKAAYLSHIGAIESENATALAAQFETNATLLFAEPHALPPNGSLVGIANITRFYEEGGPAGGASLKAPYAAANDTYSITMSNDGRAGSVTSHLIFYGNDPVARPMAAYFYDVSLDISYVLQGDRWLISTESLTYNNFSSCAAISLSPDGSILTCEYGSG